MKNIIKIIIASAILSSNVFATQTELPCILSNTGEVTDSGNCYVTPSQYKFKLYKLLMCYTTPSIMSFNRTDTVPDLYKEDFVGCDTLFDNANGQELITYVGSETKLNNAELKASDKIYTHYAVVVGNSLSMKASVVFNAPKTGISGTGKYCWTTNTTANSSSIDNVVQDSNGDDFSPWWHEDNRANWTMQCGSSPSEAGEFTQRIDRVGNRANNGNMVDSDEFRDTMRLIGVDDTYVVHQDNSGLSKLVLYYPLNSPIDAKNINSLNIQMIMTNSAETNQNGISNNQRSAIIMTGPFAFDIQAR